MLKRIFSSGFSIVELMVVISFMAIMSALVIVSVNKFSRDISLSNLSYDIALTIRQAQNYGASVRDRSVSGAGNFTSGYGVRFSKSDNKKFVFFADDSPSNGCCVSGGGNCDDIGIDTISSCISSSEFLKYFTIGNGNYISKFCGVRKTDSVEGSCVGECSNATGEDGIDFLDITFLRPGSEAFIKTSKNKNENRIDKNNGNNRYVGACVEVSSPTGTKKTTRVSFLGYISVK